MQISYSFVDKNYFGVTWTLYTIQLMRKFGMIFSLLLVAGCAKDDDEKLVISTIYPSLITSTTSQAGGKVISGDAKERGVCWSLGSSPTILDDITNDGSGLGEFVSNMTELQPGKVYYFRAYAKNGDVVSYGNLLTFETKGAAPTIDEKLYIITKDETNVIFGGKVCANELDTEVLFEYGFDTNYGFSIPAAQSPVMSPDCIEVSASLRYEPSAIYHYRIKATNILGTAYSKDYVFKSPSPHGTKGFVTDVDGNTYSTISLLGNEWMAENLNVTHLNNGVLIPLITDPVQWSQLKTPARAYWMNDSINNSKDFGALYNWYTVSDSKLCPADWHMPSREDWESLINLGIVHLKDASAHYWNDTNGDNSSGFSARAGGLRVGNEGNWTGKWENAAWWVAPIINSDPIWALIDRLDDKKIKFYGHYQTSGLSIRCIKD